MSEHNAKITNVMLGLEDHGIPTAYVTCEWDGSGQGFGGFDLRSKSGCLNFVMGVQKAVGVRDWSALKGQFCRIKREGGMIVAIGHIVDDRWFTKDQIYDS